MTNQSSSENVPGIQVEPDSSPGRLIEAALQAFSAKGFHGTTTRSIASAAGMSPAALYVHHKSKEEMLYLISRTGHEEIVKLVRDGVASSSNPVEQLLEIVRGYAVWHARHHTRARIANYELAALSSDHLSELTLVRRAIEHEMREVIEAGIAAGTFLVRDSHMTARVILSMGIDIARWYKDDGEWTPDDIAEHYCEFALRIVEAEDPRDPRVTGPRAGTPSRRRSQPRTRRGSEARAR